MAILFSAYRKADYADVDGFMAQLGAVLSAYPKQVVVHVTSPLTGIQRRLKFPPTIAEIVEACEEVYVPIRRAMGREQARRDAARALPGPFRRRTAEEQERIDSQVAEVRQKLGMPQPKTWIEPLKESDGKHALRVAADLDRRRAMRETSV